MRLNHLQYSCNINLNLVFIWEQRDKVDDETSFSGLT